jgi:hypothetical protein
MTDLSENSKPPTDRGNSLESDLPDPFDPARLALKGNPAETIGFKRILAHVPVRRAIA